ncbi:hypothetical protein MKW94_017666 [Papaver nudicaule]|uniref:Uncharacterized protein n=1 Tax=Papaver nudicaule TaxID=74823 RepID=A0AA41VJP9_PAPNU|nr:hypothetical protein [Papaver nudicaule]
MASSPLNNLYRLVCCQISEAHDLLIQRVAEEVKLTSKCASPKSTKQVNFDVEKYCQNNEATGAAVKYHSGSDSFYDDHCHHPNCWMNGSKDRFLEVLLMVSSFLLSFSTAGALYFTQALTIVGSHDPVLKHSLAAFKWAFASSFLSNFLGVVVLLILQSRREYHQYKKLSLIISNTASFVFMVLGYGLLIAFNIGRH